MNYGRCLVSTEKNSEDVSVTWLSIQQKPLLTRTERKSIDLDTVLSVLKQQHHLDTHFSILRSASVIPSLYLTNSATLLLPTGLSPIYNPMSCMSMSTDGYMVHEHDYL